MMYKVSARWVNSDGTEIGCSTLLSDVIKVQDEVTRLLTDDIGASRRTQPTIITIEPVKERIRGKG